MTRATNHVVSATKIMKGISNANRSYEKLTNGDWLDYAPEYFVTVEIARVLGADSTPISLEVSTRQTIRDGTGKGRGKHFKVLDGLKRFDIVCYEKSGEQLPRAIVEVKHPYYGDLGMLEKDIARVATALTKAASNRARAKKTEAGRKRASLRHGFLAFYAYTATPERRDDGSADARLKRWIGEIEKRIVRSYPGVRAKGYKKPIRKEGNDHAYAVVIAMTAPPTAE